MNTKTFNQNFQLDRKARSGVRANPKNEESKIVEVLTADGTIYDSTVTYYFFDEQTKEVRQSIGLRREGEFLSVFGLKVVAVSNLHLTRDDALAAGQAYFKSEIERLQSRIESFEMEKAAHLIR